MKSTCDDRPGIVFVALLMALMAATGLAGCSKNPVKEARPPRPPVPVLVARAEVRDVPVEIRAVGNIQAYASVAVRSQITGPIMQVHFEEGREVAAGDRLFTIDPRPFEAALNQAQANVRRDEAQFLSARLGFQRTSNLFQSKIASQQDYDAAEAVFASAEATVVADRAAVSNVQVSLGYTEIRAPMAGRTGDLKVKAGNVVKAPDDVLVNLTQTQPIYAVFSVPEQNLPAIQQCRQSGPLSVTAFIPGEKTGRRGELTFVNNVVDTTTGTISLKATFANEDKVLWPGQFIQATLTLSNLVQATVVPTQAVQTGQSGEYVFVAKPDDTVEMRSVATSLTRDGMTVILSGVQPAEIVVTDGQLRLTPGAKISIKPAEVLTGSTNAAANPGKN